MDRSPAAAGLELVVIGAGPAYSTRPGALGSSYLVRTIEDQPAVEEGAAVRAGNGSGEENRSDRSLAPGQSLAIVLDLGQGTFPWLAAEIEPAQLAAVLISHLHPDHFVDLVPLRHYLRYGFAPPRRLPVLAPAGLEERLDALLAEPGFTAAALEVTPLVSGRFTLGTLEVIAAPVTHIPGSFAFRVARADHPQAPGLVYSGDCGVAGDLLPLLRPGDWLLVEASWGPGPAPVPGLHLDGQQIGELAVQGRPGRILLTHLQDGYGQEETVHAIRQAGFRGPVAWVAPRRRFRL
jgi:ribonuclease BN (tRNA processing enzyme)